MVVAVDLLPIAAATKAPIRVVPVASVASFRVVVEVGGRVEKTKAVLFHRQVAHAVEPAAPGDCLLATVAD